MTCLFCKIVSGTLPATILAETSELIAFRDNRPQAPSHVLVIPKRHIATIDETTPEDAQLLGDMVLTAKHVAQLEGLTADGYRLVFNVNSDGGQTVYHIHLHLIGGRKMAWPPG